VVVSAGLRVSFSGLSADFRAPDTLDYIVANMISKPKKIVLNHSDFNSRLTLSLQVPIEYHQQGVSGQRATVQDLCDQGYPMNTVGSYGRHLIPFIVPLPNRVYTQTKLRAMGSPSGMLRLPTRRVAMALNQIEPKASAA